MEKKEYIVLINFQSVSDGLNYLNEFNTPFCFLVGGSTYDGSGNLITTPNDFIQYESGEIWIDIHETPHPGELYVESGFLKFYKEL